MCDCSNDAIIGILISTSDRKASIMASANYNETKRTTWSSSYMAMLFSYFEDYSTDFNICIAHVSGFL
jgi:hypothetical protein